MTVRRAAVAVLVAVATVPVTAAPAAGHGAPTDPLSRAAACAPGSRYAATAPCRAAVEAGAAVREWDNVRVAAVNGRDRERIADGELCSGGLSAYRGLDLARADWPATELTAGATVTFRYRTTIPHRGTFRLYLTRPDYAPTTPLTWDDLERVPFLRVTDPPVRDGAYQLRGRLPADRTGRQLIYTIWQNSDTPDTYYSCSDVEFRPPAGTAGFGGAAPDPGGAAPGPASPAAPRTAVAAPAGAEPAATGTGVAVASVRDGHGGGRPLLAGAAVALAVLLLSMAGTRWRRADRAPVGRPCAVRSHRADRPRTW
ncbi:lytic polysaccharide monooxygenase [Micromonospora sp. C28SCA-DRY-2]|uniref:lytic polysaccharide monooxygenase auxiliary activity family 9 protein n=1 Tax=Micromonospora sp. C28SCA-DRY-2 TaxID=3059522 RepID=UPI00267561A5|nr:lytic polysaccharide monooxygenase [Micromonospora sp. C28SCA-DRY-2]MDO3701016.1 lytic polysaccharide monooxygenase [Micromonospora sp. C28SCA-DRY-2]